MGEREDTFVGRSEELGRCRRWMAEGHRIISIVGPPGAGKTRLVKELLRGGDAPTPAWRFCDLTEARTIDDLVTVVERALDRSTGEFHLNLRTQHLGLMLSELGEAAVILDNFEQLLPSGRPIVEQWAHRAPQCHFLVTSRQRLGVQRERVLTLKPLPVPEEKEQGGQEVLGCASVALFIDRAKSVAPRLALSDENIARIAGIVRLVDGLPLAIELAAARVAMMTLSQLRSRLQNRFEVLRSGWAERAHHATLDAAIRWSWELLEPWQQAALAHCTVFRGGFERRAAEQIVDLQAWPSAPPVGEVVDSLVDRSLVTGPGADTEPGRYHILPVIAEFASREFAGFDRLKGARARHARYFAELAATVRGTRDSPEGVRVLSGDLANLRAVVERYIEGQIGDEGAAIAALRALGPVLWRFGRYDLVIEYINGFLDRGGIDRLPPDQVLRSLVARAEAFAALGQMREALSHAEETISWATKTGNPEALAAALLGKARVYWAKDDYAKALPFEEQALELLDGVSPGRTTVRALSWNAMTKSMLGRRVEALAQLKQVLSLVEASGRLSAQGAIHEYIGTTLLFLGRIDESIASYESAVGFAQQLGDRVMHGWRLVLLATTLMCGDHMDRAHQQFELALELLHKHGRALHREQAYRLLGDYYVFEGRFDQAERYFEMAGQELRLTGNPKHLSLLLQSEAILSWAQEQYAQARVSAAEALRVHGTHDPEHRSHVLTVQACLAACDGDLEAAGRLAVQSAKPLLGTEHSAFHELQQLSLAFLELAHGRAATEAAGRESHLAAANDLLRALSEPVTLQDESAPARPWTGRFAWLRFVAGLLERELERLLPTARSPSA